MCHGLRRLVGHGLDFGITAPGFGQSNNGEFSEAVERVLPGVLSKVDLPRDFSSTVD
jgi:hypothetical protein